MLVSTSAGDGTGSQETLPTGARGFHGGHKATGRVDGVSSRALKVRFAGVGSSVPERVVTNEELSEVLDTTDEWITSRTGIRERRYAEPGTGASVHGALAARKALEVAEVDPSDVDLIICATVSPDYVIPSTAALIQRELGCKQAGGFDLSGACCGYVYAVDTAARFVATGAARNALVVGSEVMTAVSDKNSSLETPGVPIPNYPGIIAVYIGKGNPAGAGRAMHADVTASSTRR